MIEVKAYQPEDYEQVVALYQNKRAYGGNFDADRDEPGKLAATAEAGNLFVAVDDGRVLGTVMILDNPHTFWLLRFAVDPEAAQATETAKLLFDKVSAVAAQRGHHSVIVYTDSEDETLNRRYEELGCHKAGNYRCYWKEAK